MISKVLLISDSSLTQEPNQEGETDTAESGEDENEGESEEGSEGEQRIPSVPLSG